MQAISIIILIWVYAVAVVGFVKIFSKILEINYDLTYFSIIISLVGVGLGLLFYWMSMLNKNIKNFVITGIPAFILILIISTYLVAGIVVLIELFILLLKILIFLVMCTIPLAAVYGMLKKQKNLLLISGAGILFFFFLVILLSKAQNDVLLPLYSENQVAVLILFFVLFLCFLELGTAAIFFKSAVDKMTSNKDNDENLFFRFNRVSNRYIAYISLVLSLCYILSMLVLWEAGYDLFFNSEGILGINFGSVYGILFLTILTLGGALVFWYLVPREKIKPSEGFFQYNSFNNPDFTNINEE